MNAALTDVFPGLLLSNISVSFQQRRIQKTNIIFVELFDWFVSKYGTTMAEDRNANRQQMAAD